MIQKLIVRHIHIAGGTGAVDAECLVWYDGDPEPVRRTVNLQDADLCALAQTNQATLAQTSQLAPSGDWGNAEIMQRVTEHYTLDPSLVTVDQWPPAAAEVAMPPEPATPAVPAQP